MKYNPEVYVRTEANVKLPVAATPNAAGYDVFAHINAPITVYAERPPVLIPTGLYMQPEHGNMAGLILPRSSLGHKQGLILGNTAGLIDADYQGQWMVSAYLRVGNVQSFTIHPGDRIAQILFIPVLHPTFIRVESLPGETHRGEGGFGSTGV